MCDVFFLQEVQSIHGLQLYSAAFTRLLLHEKLLDACEDIMGTPNILLHHTKAHSKPPGTGSPFPMHQVLRRLTHISVAYMIVFTCYCYLHIHLSHNIGKVDKMDCVGNRGMLAQYTRKAIWWSSD